MPLYEFRCDNGHVTEWLVPVGVEQTGCRCGARAQRQFPSRFGIVGPTTDLRSMYRRFNEASAEMGHNAQKVEANTGQSVRLPDYWGQAKDRASKALQAGYSAAPAKE